MKKELVREKTAQHRRLEEALQHNKETVLTLVSKNLSDSSLVRGLREDARSLTMLLTREIRREVEEEERRGKYHF